jgi:hypothetical protein
MLIDAHNTALMRLQVAESIVQAAQQRTETFDGAIARIDAQRPFKWPDTLRRR